MAYGSSDQIAGMYEDEAMLKKTLKLFSPKEIFERAKEKSVTPEEMENHMKVIKWLKAY